MPAHEHESDTTTTDPLARERAHLAASRAALRAMREDAEALDIRDVTANWVNAAVLQRPDRRPHQGARRPLPHPALLRPPRLPARRPAPTRPRAPRASSFYIGRRHVHDADGDPMVIDWRAPVSQPFYRASKKDPMDVGLRRRFGYTGGELTAYEDEHLTDPAEAAHDQQAAPGGDRAAARRPDARHRGDDPARAGRDRPQPGSAARSACRAAPGTGKTAVGLHRVAYLLYAHRERLARTGTLVIGPNRVLPALHRAGAARPGRAGGQAGDRRRPGRRTSRCAGTDDGGPRPSSRATRGWRRCCGGRSVRM